MKGSKGMKGMKGMDGIDKAILRENMKLMRASVTEDERIALDSAICDRLLGACEYRRCNKLFAYISFGTEAGTSAIIEDALNNCKEVYAPGVEGRDMRFYRINGSKLIKSKFGIYEPDPEYCTPYMKDDSRQDSLCMLLPGLAFDSHGNRVGYGAGYYDRFLSGHGPESFIKIALAYDFQVVPHIDSGNHDIKADIIITPGKRIDCNSLL